MKGATASIGEKEFLTPEETRAYLSIGKTTLEEWRKKGLKAIKVERKVYFSKTDISDFLRRFEI